MDFFYNGFFFYVGRVFCLFLFCFWRKGLELFFIIVIIVMRRYRILVLELNGILFFFVLGYV